MIKIFGIGNPLLCDDGIGVRLSKDIADNVISPVYTGEIFADYCLDYIDEDDFIVIIDAVSLNQTVGQISVVPFVKCKEYFQAQPFCHDASLLYLLLNSHINYKGCLIGIEVKEISYKDCLSEELATQYESIKDKVINIISNLKEE